jgi:hypothetical protein
MTSDRHTFTTTLWLARDDAPWHFVTLPRELADLVADQAPPRSGFGSVRVEVTVGATTWRTSLFPDSKAGSYVLPVKKEVREREQLAVGDDVTVALGLVQP